MSNDWFRNAIWDDSVERDFEEKLRRSRKKQQYLRIQACTLAPSNPHVALALLERYFEMGDDVDHAQAHVDRAKAFLVLGQMNDALNAYEAALKREREFPNLLTHAYLDLPFIIAISRLLERYGQALELLEIHKSRLMFPVDLFQWHAAKALIFEDLSNPDVAKANAEQAFIAAGREESGFRYHPSIGLVTDKDKSVIVRLKEILAR